MSKIKLATVWLAGCSGCHMSFLDLDEWLFELAKFVDLVHSPFADVKEYPDDVDVCLIEGAIANEENLEIALNVRKKTKFVVSFGDCAITANVPAMRNMLGKAEPVLKRCYLELSETQPQLPHEPGIVPELLDRVTPLHELINIDMYIPGCPPPAQRIKEAIAPLVQSPPTPLGKGGASWMAGRDMIKFG